MITDFYENTIFVKTLNLFVVELDSDTILFFHGDRIAIETVYRTEFKSCRDFVLRNRGTFQDAQDCFQVAIEATYRRGREPCLLLGVPLKAYLFGAVRNIWYKSLRDRKETVELVLEAYEEILLQQYFPFEEDERKQLVEKALAQMGVGCRELIMGFYILGGQLKEIAELQGWTYNSAKTKKAKCLNQLKRKFHSALTQYQDLMTSKTVQHG
jgi:RNA polymerase sigma factor (sigma-70 family)